MSRRDRRVRNSHATKMTSGGLASWSELPADAQLFMAAICRATVPSMPLKMMTDQQIVAAVQELIRQGLIDVYFHDVPGGIHVFSDLKQPGRGVISTNGPVLIPFVAGSA